MGVRDWKLSCVFSAGQKQRLSIPEVSEQIFEKLMYGKLVQGATLVKHTYIQESAHMKIIR